MLKSTHKAPAAVAPEPSPLPPDWTEHKAPSGHSYYYNAETKQSTYTRPSFPAVTPSTQPGLQNVPNKASGPFIGTGQQHVPGSYQPSGDFRGGRSYQDRSRRKDNDRPKSQIAIPDAQPWILVKTKLGRRFVYNPERDESFWKFPQDVLLAVIKLDEAERQRKEREDKEKTADSEQQRQQPEDEFTARSQEPDNLPHRSRLDHEDSDSYEEVEVTDDEAGDDEVDHKRPKLDEDDAPVGPVVFGEDDIEYQLAAMGEEYGLEPEDYGGEDQEDIALSKEDSTALFRDLLDDFRINPYTTWEKLIEDGLIIEDDRYTVLPNSRTRKEVFQLWSNDRIQELKERRQKEEKKDPRIAYLRFLHEHATPKLYWPEFKRKFKKEPELRDTKLSDKDREKLYRDYINRLKLSESTRKSDLTTLLKSTPLQSLNQSTTLNTLPSTLLTDLRFISLPPSTRDSLVEAYISTLDPAPSSDVDQGGGAASTQRSTSRQRREKALADRERAVQEEKRRQRGRLREGRELLREGEEEVREAMKVGGNRGIAGYAPSDVDRGGEK